MKRYRPICVTALTSDFAPKGRTLERMRDCEQAASLNTVTGRWSSASSGRDTNLSKMKGLKQSSGNLQTVSWSLRDVLINPTPFGVHFHAAQSGGQAYDKKHCFSVLAAGGVMLLRTCESNFGSKSRRENSHLVKSLCEGVKSAVRWEPSVRLNKQRYGEEHHF